MLTESQVHESQCTLLEKMIIPKPRLYISSKTTFPNVIVVYRYQRFPKLWLWIHAIHWDRNIIWTKRFFIICVLATLVYGTFQHSYCFHFSNFLSYCELPTPVVFLLYLHTITPTQQTSFVFRSKMVTWWMKHVLGC